MNVHRKRTPRGPRVNDPHDNPRANNRHDNPRANNRHDNPRVNSRHDGQQQDPMILSDKEIAEFVAEISAEFSIDFNVNELTNPHPQRIQMVFELFAMMLPVLTPEVVAPAMKAAADDMVGEVFADRLFPGHNRNYMALFRNIRNLTEMCGIPDFELQDLHKPTYDRLKKIFSYLINFYRFRYSQGGVVDLKVEEQEGILLRIRQLAEQNEEMSEDQQHLEENHKTTETEMAAKEKRKEELKQRLLDLKMGQEKVVEKLEMVKQEQRRVKELLGHKTEQKMNVRNDAAKLRLYTTQSPAVLEASLKDLNTNLAADRAAIDALDRRGRTLQTFTETFTAVANDVDDCRRLLDDVSQDIKQEQEELTKAEGHKQTLSERSNNVRNVERQEKLLTKQLANVNARTEKLRKNAEDKADAARVRMEELKKVHKKLTEERGEKSREMERRRVRIERTEKKMTDLKENIENEVNTTREQYMQLESHVKSYITKMDQSISS